METLVSMWSNYFLNGVKAESSIGGTGDAYRIEELSTTESKTAKRVLSPKNRELSHPTGFNKLTTLFPGVLKRSGGFRGGLLALQEMLVHLNFHLYTPSGIPGAL